MIASKMFAVMVLSSEAIVTFAVTFLVLAVNVRLIVDGLHVAFQVCFASNRTAQTSILIDAVGNFAVVPRCPGWRDLRSIFEVDATGSPLHRGLTRASEHGVSARLSQG